MAGKPISFQSNLLSSSCPLTNLSTTNLLPNSPLHSSANCPASSIRVVKVRVPFSVGKDWMFGGGLERSGRSKASGGLGGRNTLVKAEDGG